MRILVTGGHGFIGTHLTKKLLENYYDVTVVDAHYDYGTIEKNYLDYLINKRIKFIKEHYFIIDELHELPSSKVKLLKLFNPDVIYHLANVPRQYEVSRNINEAIKNATGGLYEVLELKPELFVYVSTSMVYGDFKEQTTEEVIPQPKSQYGVIRLMCENFVQSYCKKNNIPYVIVRPSAVYGEFDSNIRVVGKMFDDVLNGENIEVHGINEVLDFTHVDDLTDGLVSIIRNIENPLINNSIFNMTYSDTKPKTLLDLAHYIVDIVKENDLVFRDNNKNKDPIRLIDRNDNFPKRSTLSIELARNVLNYNPKIDLETGLRMYYNWLSNYL